MSRKIFRSIWLMTVVSLVLALAILSGMMYTVFTEEQLEQLRNETALVTRGVTRDGAAFFDELETADFRITWLTADGRILYDNAADAGEMENHLERQEVRDALETGYGESRRRSATLARQQLYTARRLPDGTVLRLSITQMAVMNMLLPFLAPFALLLLLATLLTWRIAHRLASDIVGPLNSLDPDEPMKGMADPQFVASYEEILPLLHRLEEQRVQIAHDREELEKTSQIRQEFTANASHELKTPLHVISGYAELLESGMVPEGDIRTFAGRILAESRRMSRLVEDILSLTRMDGGVGMEKEETDLYQIAESAAADLQETAAEAGVTLRLLPRETKDTTMLGVTQVLYSIVYNLCNNGIKYNHRGGLVTIRIGLAEQADRAGDDRAGDGSPRGGRMLRLTVTDTGIGIPEEDRERIFERFYRVDKSRSKEVGGTGLGLSIVKHAVRIHGGEIRVDSREGQGTVFTVDLPREFYNDFTKKTVQP